MNRIASLALCLSILIASCNGDFRSSPVAAPLSDTLPRYVELQHPGWIRSATLYEVNLRQYTPEGTFRAFERELPRLKALGVDILWLMPVQPIGRQNRKGSLGSYYSVRDYYGVNPEFGGMSDFKHLVDAVHQQGMRVIIDWVANHSAWDNPIAKQHPDWYTRNRDGSFQSTPWRDYDDIIDFDYSKPGLRRYMTDAMAWWVRETGIDGYRCDVAAFVPLDFWEGVRKKLDAIRPVFLLAEAADRDLHRRAFDATYSWALWDQLHAVCKAGKPAESLAGGYIAEHVSTWPEDAIRVQFTDNHDKNAWEGAAPANFGKGLHAAIVLTALMDGMPLVYSGQEAGLDRPLQFFEKDLIPWKPDSAAALISRLFALKHAHPALWNGHWGGPMVRIKNNRMGQVLSFVREKGKDKVIVVVNLSDKEADVTLETRFDAGNYTDAFSGMPVSLGEAQHLQLGSWSWKVYTSAP
ncbi:alpha-amlyase [Flaviaesturariibacter flavus]|uniref:Alpha-amlyase n=1 Tax=Flaviaesturariibacter flavus TaxID=2502780 RepID=A0A4R1BKF5_9BACT|nr:alpha-amylase family glycosyl hydrolase [Flaviaesturariibacter flavus]TCJ17799.1 alpha-amlyase [Flaviaesturariibacter flavus]